MNERDELLATLLRERFGDVPRRERPGLVDRRIIADRRRVLVGADRPQDRARHARDFTHEAFPVIGARYDRTSTTRGAAA